jgi:hypothetical protein
MEYCRPGWEEAPAELGLSPANPLKLHIQNGLKEASRRFINEEIVENQYDWLF